MVFHIKGSAHERRGCMNAVEIEEAVSKLAEAAFDAAEFPFALLEAFGNKPATIKQLRSGHSNKTDVDGGRSARNPAANLRKPPQPKGRTRRLEGDEGQRLMMACQASDNPYLAPLVTLAIETAMRRGELLGLDWDDLRLEQNYVHLALTKNGTSRDVPLSPKARQTIEALPRSISGRVIPIHPEALKGLWHRATRRADITGLRFHDLRHEATTRFFEKGLGVMEVAAITGHKDLRMLQRYVQLRPEDLARKLAWGD
jgi:integrase